MLLFPETATHSPRPAAYATSKLRDSCQACAVSKVKCPREKPACSRCSSRGILCEYFFTKRPGRRRAPSSMPPVTIAASVPPAPGCCSDNSTPAISSGLSTSSHRSSWSQYGVATCALLPPPGPYAPSKDAVPTGPSPGPVVPASPPPALDTTASEDFFSVFLSPSHLSWDLSEPDPLYGYSINDSAPSDGNPPARDASASLLIPDEMGSLDMAVADAWSAADLLMQAEVSTALATSSHDAPAAVTPEHKVEDNWVPCACLPEALDLVKSLSSPSSSTPSAILLENKLGIEAVERLLACPWCAEDSFLLAVLAMAVLRVVERYAAASQHRFRGESEGEDNIDRAANRRASSTSSSTSSTSTSTSSGSGSGKSHNKHSHNNSTNGSSSSSSSNGIGSSRSSPTAVSFGRHQKTVSRSYSHHGCGADKGGRKHAAASRQILGELHRAQRVVNKLSPRLRASSSTAADAAQRTRTAGVPAAASALLSEGTLEGVERDLRKGLRTLSADIIRCLQQG